MRILLCAAVLRLFCGTLHAQIDTATAVGTVRDTTGGIISGAEVEFRKTATNETFTTLTNATGDYRLHPLPIGEYEIRATSPGFKTEVRSGVTLGVGRTVRVDLSLSVGQRSETVAVSAEAPLLTSESAGMGQVIDNKKLVGLPLNTRDFATLASLSPGVVPPRGSLYGSGPAIGVLTGINVRGMSRADNVFHLDGSMIQEGNGATTFRPNIDAIEEFEIKTGLYGAEYGVKPGGQIIAVTKSGTNDLHGNLFWLHRNDNLDARNFFQARKTEFKRNQFGATAGGPIYLPGLLNGKDKAWFFVAYQKEVVRSFRPLTGVVPTAAEKSGQFATTILDPLTRQAFPGNRIPTDRIGPISQKLLKFWPEPNTPGSLNFTSPNSTANVDNPQFIAKVDFKTSDADKWSGRFAWDSNPFITADPIQEFSFRNPLGTWLQEITNTRTVAGRLVNVAGLHFFRRPYFVGVTNAHVEDARNLNVSSLLSPRLNPTGGVPRMSPQGYLAIGDNGGPGTSTVHIGNWQGRDDLSFQKGAHFLKTGVEFRKHYNFWNLGSGPSYTFANRYTGNGFADFLLGYPTRTQTGGESIRGSFAQNNYYFYVHDDWKVHAKLTLNLGVRYELRLPWRDKRGFMSNFLPSTQALRPALQNLTLQPWETGRFEPNVSLFDFQRRALLPRVGLAFRALEKTVLRLGYGIYSNDPSLTSFQSLGGNPRPQSQVLVFNADLTSPTISVSDPFPTALATSAVPTLTGVETPLKLSAVHSWGLSIQQEVVPNVSLEIAYQGSHSSNQMETVSINDAAPGSGNRQQRRPYPAYQTINITQPSSDGSYHGLELKAQKRAGQDGLYVLGAFTWSKALDTAAINSNILGTQRLRSRNMSLSRHKATSDAYIPRRLVVTAGYDLPFGAAKPFLHEGLVAKLIGGFTLQGIAVFQDGTYFSVFLPGDALDTGSAFSQWPDLARNPNLPASERTRTRWFDTAAFVRPTGFVYGNAGRAPVEGPGIINLDISLQRDFRFTDTRRVQFRLEAFNVANHTNFNLPGQNFGTADFGVIGSALDGRAIQVGFKVFF